MDVGNISNVASTLETAPAPSLLAFNRGRVKHASLKKVDATWPINIIDFPEKDNLARSNHTK